MKQLDKEALYYIEMYSHYKQGFLEIEGGVLDQSNKYLRVMALINSLYGDLEEKRQTKEAKRGGSKC